MFWATAAEQDRVDIFDFIAQDNPLAAMEMDERFSQAAGRLGMHPEVGKPGLIAGTRELIPHESFRLVYEVQQDELWILALVHTARLWPPKQS